MTTTALVREFKEAFGQRIRTHVADHNAEVRLPETKLRFSLIQEELGELQEAIDNCDTVEVLDALGDIVYVVDGAALVFGIDKAVDALFEESLNNLTEGEALNPDRSTALLMALREALLRGNSQETIEALALIKAYTFNTAAYLDLPLLEAIRAIHRSNMSKLGEDGKPIYRESDGKVLKGPNYQTPTADLEYLLFGETSADTSN
jgi:predicted HAD superfamily Cof-like phosphohydrolase